MEQCDFMYIPKSFQVNDRNELLHFIKKYSFGTLVSYAGGLSISQLPFYIDSNGHYIYGHLAKANPQYSSLLDAEEVMVVFSGPNAYVSPTWYADPQMVPTWNFQCVCVRGHVKLLGSDELQILLTKLTEQYEAAHEKPWTMDGVTSDNMEAMLAHIGGFSIGATEIFGKYKLSQNRSPENRKGVIAGLEKETGEMSKIIAELMRQNP